MTTHADATPRGGEAAGGHGIGARWKGLLGAIDRYQRAHPWAGFPYAVVKKFGDDQAGNLAALVAYYGFFSLFPLLLVLVTVLGFLLHSDPHLRDRIVSSALAQFPVIGDQLRGNVGGLSGSGVGLAVGLVGLLWGGLGAMQAMQNAMNGVWNVPMKNRPNFIGTRVRAVLMLGVLGAAIVASTLVAGIGVSGANRPLAIRVVGLVLTVAVDLGLFLLAFRVLTDLDLRWGQLLPGAAVAAVAWAILQIVGGYYVSHQLKGASQTYGMFAVVIGLLSWLYLQAQLTLLAAEVNVVRERRLWPRGLQADDLTDADRRALRHYAEVEERMPEEDVDVDLRDARAEVSAAPR
jgi:YihY family inner membrane protein